MSWSMAGLWCSFIRFALQDDDAALLEQALAMSMAEAAAAAAAGSTAGDLTMAESGGDDQDLAFGKFG